MYARIAPAGSPGSGARVVPLMSSCISGETPLGASSGGWTGGCPWPRVANGPITMAATRNQNRNLTFVRMLLLLSVLRNHDLPIVRGHPDPPYVSGMGVIWKRIRSVDSTPRNIAVPTTGAISVTLLSRLVNTKPPSNISLRISGRMTLTLCLESVGSWEVLLSCGAASHGFQAGSAVTSRAGRTTTWQAPDIVVSPHVLELRDYPPSRQSTVGRASVKGKRLCEMIILLCKTTIGCHFSLRASAELTGLIACQPCNHKELAVTTRPEDVLLPTPRLMGCPSSAFEGSVKTSVYVVGHLSCRGPLTSKLS